MLRKRKIQYILLLISILLFIVILIYLDPIYEKLAKYGKIRNFHDPIQHLSTQIEYNSAVIKNLNKSKIYFIHVPRTGSDTLRTHMIGKTSLLYDTSHYSSGTFEQRLLLTSNEFNKFKEYYIIKGFYSYNDLFKYNVFNKTISKNIIITIFRNPIERILSLYEFSRHGFLFDGIDHGLTLKEFLTTKNDIIQSLINNSMTWQFAFHLLINKRKYFIQKYNITIDDKKIYDLAKNHLQSIDFIAFYENLMFDYNELNFKIFSKLNKNHFLLDLLFNIGTWCAFLRLRVLKYNARIKYNNDIQVILNQLTFYDMKLYNYAKNNIRQIHFITFDSYFQASLFILFILIQFIFAIFLFSRLWFKLKRKFKLS